jgi:hypothetical protein
LQALHSFEHTAELPSATSPLASAQNKQEAQPALPLAFNLDILNLFALI